MELQKLRARRFLTLAHSLIFICVICSSASYGAGFDKAILDSKLTSSSKTADHGIIFTRLSDGKVLYETGADQLLSPASVTKVITSAAALSYFGPAYGFKTPVFYTGKLTNGQISGNLYVQGNGDPFLVSEILWQTAVDLRHLGLKSVAGDIIIDTSLFDGEERDDSRKTGTKHSTHAYDAPVSAFAVNFNTVAAAVAPTINGKPALVSLTPFALDHVKVSGRVSTIRGSTSDGVSAARTSMADGGISMAVSGAIGEEAGIKKIYRSVASPTVAAGDYVRGFLEDAGIRIKGKVKLGSVPPTATKIYDIQGYEMRRIASGLNTFSNNFIADMLTKRLGAAFPIGGLADQRGSGTLANGVNVLSRFMKEDVGVRSNFTLLNGSGLSTENRLSARQIAQVLSWMEQQGELFPDFLGSLPANGWDGTLKKRMKKADTLAGMIRAKTGTLTEPITVAGMAGYFRHPSEGWVSFVMITNGREGRGQPGLLEMRNLQDDLLKSLLTRAH